MMRRWLSTRGLRSESAHTVNIVQLLDACRTVLGKVVNNNVCFISEHAKKYLLWFLMASKLDNFLQHKQIVLVTLFFVSSWSCV